MTKFSNKLKKTLFLAHFGPFFPILGQKKVFPENLALSHTNFYHAKFQKKLIIQFQENAWTEGRKDGQTLFYRTLPTTAGGPIKT